jgi:hypothetical protein
MRASRSSRAGRIGLLTSGAAGLALLAAVALVPPSSSAFAAATPTWTGITAPLPSNANGLQTVEATSCPTAGACIALGGYEVSGNPAVFADTLVGGQWTPTELPTPPNAKAGFSAGFGAASCPQTTSWCVGVGTYEDTSSHTLGFASVLSNGSWTTSLLPLPTPTATNPDVTLETFGLSCAAPGFCVAAGTYENSTGHGASFIDTYSAGSWTSIVTPEPPDTVSPPSGELFAVSCPAIGSCVAVGPYRGASGQRDMIDQLSGGAWTSMTSPLPGNTAQFPNDELFGLSCPQVGACVAVGDYTASDTFQKNLVVTQVGSSFVASEAPQPSDAAATSNASFNDVSCPAAGQCVAVGTYNNTSAFTFVPEVASLSGGTWTTQLAPGLTSADKDGYLNSVSCSWAASCAAVGVADTASGHTPLLDTLTAGSWAGNDGAVPSDHVPGGFDDLGTPSCAGGTCVAVGSYNVASSFSGLIDTFPNLTGYQEVASDGGLFAFGTPFYGSMGGKPLNAPVMGMAVVPDSGAYYEAASDGGIFAFHAPFYGSMGGTPLNKPVVGMAFDTLTGGYYEVASDGGLFAFNAPFYGSMGGKPLNAPIVGMAFDPLTGGYYEVASDGGLFAFHAPFQGSMGGTPLNKPVVGMAANPQTGGYYEVASDGGLFAFGAPFQGSMGGKLLNKPMVGMSFDFVTGGYYEVSSDGGLFAFNAPFQGSMGGTPLNKPVVGMAFG